jgi:hypothetical protein
MAQDIFGKSRVRKQGVVKKLLNSYKTATEQKSERVRGRQDYMKQRSSAQAVPGTMKGQQVDTTKGPTYTSKPSSGRAPGSESYKPTKTDVGPSYNKPEGNYGSVDRNMQEYKGAKSPDYTPTKESATGTLSAKTETTSSDRMSWAREAERKARKMMGGR